MAKTTKKPVNQVKKGNFPSVENQFKPGQSGNPKGAPAAKTQLWRYFCLYSAMTDKKLETLKKKQLTQAQQAAVKLIEDMKAGKFPKSSKFAEYIVNREHGKPKEHLQIDAVDSLTDTECDNIRKILRQNGS